MDFADAPCEPYCGRDDEPTGQLGWEGWAASMAARGATQSRCPVCGYYTKWTDPRPQTIRTTVTRRKR